MKEEKITLREACCYLNCLPCDLKKLEEKGKLNKVDSEKKCYRKKDILSLEKNEERDFKKVKKNGIDIGERGKYDVRNPLNNMTGSEWVHFINSIHETDFVADEDEFEIWKYLQDSLIKTSYSTKGDDSFKHKLRKKHPSPKPPQLMAEFIRFFTKKNEKILDPFMGVGGTLIGASLEDRKAVGVDLSEEYLDIYKEVCKELEIEEQKTMLGDAKYVKKMLSDEEEFDAIITDPPYANMLSKDRTGGDKTKEVGTSTPFTDKAQDLGNLEYDKFLKSMENIIKDAVGLLKEKGYVLIFTKDMQPKEGNHNMLHADLVNELIDIDELEYRGYKIWYDKTLNLYPYGYPFAFVANQLHQFILVFRKKS